MSGSHYSHYDCGTIILNVSLNRARMRWRIAYVTISFSQALLSLVRANLSQKKLQRHHSSGISASPGYALVDIKTEPLNSNDARNEAEPRSDLAASNETILTFPCFEFSSIDPEKLTKMVKDKDLTVLAELGGVGGVASKLGTDVENGIHGNEQNFDERQRIFGSNTYKKPPAKGIFYFVKDAFRDTTILILLACAALSLGFGIKEHGVQEGWYEGGSIFVAVFLVVVVSAVSNFRQERQFDKLSSISNNIQIDVLRGGRRLQISIFDIVVGDVVILKIGDQIPADGLFLDGHSLQVDESSMTGESDHVTKDCNENPFFFSGTKVGDGYGRMLVTSVGMKTQWGEMMSSIARDSNERTPLQARLDKLTSSIGKVGLTVAFLVLVVLLIRYFTRKTQVDSGYPKFEGSKTSINDVLDAVVRIVAAAVTIVVVAIPEGLPLAVTLTLAFSMKRMMADHAMVRKLSACETMGSAKIICTDKTGTLTLNQMKVTEFWLGQEAIGEYPSKLIAPNVLELFHQAVGLNTTGSVYKPDPGSVPEFSGSPTEKAILCWAVQELGMDIEDLKQSYTVLHVETFNSEKKRSGVSVGEKANNKIHVHWKGAAEMVLAMCSNYYESTGTTTEINEDKRMQLEKIIQGMAASSLRCIAFAHKQIAGGKMECNEEGMTKKLLKEDGLTLLGIVGLKDPCRPGVKKAVEACREAGVEIKMITGDNVFTAKAIATECGILVPDQRAEDEDGEVVEGVDFRNYTDEERKQKVDKIRVLARSSPFDKLLMVRCLKQKGLVVAVTGDGTNDAPALKEADIGLSMGIQGTEVAKESSDIVILDDNFTSVATVLRWGRCVYNNIQKFIQFQLTVNIAALVINFVAAVSAGDVPLTAVQMLWVNLIMDSLGALALATERPTDELMRRPPVGRTEPLITNVMWRNLLAQALYQIIVLLILQFQGESLFKVSDEVNDTLIFNTFVLCQVFNEFNSRKLEKKNVFVGILKNRLFLGIVGVTIALQVVMVEVLNKFANTEKLNWRQWAACTGIAALSWPIGWLVKFVPVSQKPFFSHLQRLKIIPYLSKLLRLIHIFGRSCGLSAKQNP